MKAVWVGLGFGVALVLQMTLPLTAVGAVAPVDLVLVVVVAVAVANGPIAGLWVGTVGGLLQDGLSGTVVGVGGFAKTLIGYLAGQCASRLLIARPWQQLLVFFFASLVHAVCLIRVHSLLSDEGMMIPYTAVLVQAAVNAGIGVVLVISLQVGPAVLERLRLRRRSLSRRFGS